MEIYERRHLVTEVSSGILCLMVLGLGGSDGVWRRCGLVEKDKLLKELQSHLTS